MKKLLRVPIALVLLLLARPALADIMEFVAPEELESGQKGYGLTVFQGTKPERFEVEFVSTIPNPSYEKEKAILIRLGKPLQDSNVIAGMSGSPIYFKHNGTWKLAGALAFGYRLPSSGEAVAGVTPIHLMINQEEVLGLKNPVDLTPKPLLKSLMDTATPETNSEKLKPGDSIALILADGDSPRHGFGTVTYVRGNRFWAFGHSAFNGGKITVPVHKIEVATSLKSSALSFKIAKAIKEPIGVMVYDNIFAIEGVIQEIPDDLMLPVKIQLNYPNGSKANFAFRVLKHKRFTAGLMAEGMTELLSNLWNNGDVYGATSVATIEFEDRSPIVLNDSMVVGETVNAGFFSFTTKPVSTAYKTVILIEEMLNSEFNFKLSGAQVRINLQPADKTFYLDQLRVVSNSGTLIESARLGDGVNLLLALRNRDSSKKFLIMIPFKIPESLNLKDPGGDATLTFRIQSGNRFTEQNENKKLNRPPTNQDEFLQIMLADEQPVQRIYMQAVFPPTKKTSSPLALPTPWQWQPVRSLEFLKILDATEIQVVPGELAPPIADYILEIDHSVSIKLLPKAEAAKPKTAIKKAKKR